MQSLLEELDLVPDVPELETLLEDEDFPDFDDENFDEFDTFH